MIALALPMTNTRLRRVAMLANVKPIKVICYLRGREVYKCMRKRIARAIEATDAEMRDRWPSRRAA